MKSLAIVSSYSDSCGNAYFTRLLVDSFSSHGIQAVCEELDLKLTQSIERPMRRLADQHIRDIAAKLKNYDAVNIQFEAGLFGSLPSDIKRRIKILVNANKNVSITLHSPRLMIDAVSQRQAIKSLLLGKIKYALKSYLDYKRKAVHININVELIRWFCECGLKLVVHTLRSKEQIFRFFKYDNVVVHPLQMVPAGFRSNYDEFNRLKKRVGLDSDDIVIGMFGFINEYKGHTMALEALEMLPCKYKLMIFGRQHPQTLKVDELCYPYLKKLQGIISQSKNLRDRVFFMGEYDTNSFINFASCVDAIWLPYVENGQDGSGIAAICVDVGRKVLCSSSFAFDEFLRLVPCSNVYRFDIGNTIELAQRTQQALADIKVTTAGALKISPFSIDTQVEAYIR